MTEPHQTGPTPALIRQGLVKSIDACMKGEARSKAILDDLAGISPNGKGTENTSSR